MPLSLTLVLIELHRKCLNVYKQSISMQSIVHFLIVRLILSSLVKTTNKLFLSASTCGIPAHPLASSPPCQWHLSSELKGTLWQQASLASHLRSIIQHSIGCHLSLSLFKTIFNRMEQDFATLVPTTLTSYFLEETSVPTVEVGVRPRCHSDTEMVVAVLVATAVVLYIEILCFLLFRFFCYKRKTKRSSATLEYRRQVWMEPREDEILLRTYNQYVDRQD